MKKAKKLLGQSGKPELSPPFRHDSTQIKCKIAADIKGEKATRMIYILRRDIESSRREAPRKNMQ